MPWTRKQVKYLLSDVSPLSSHEKKKVKKELHENPSLGHAKKKHHSADNGAFLDSRMSKFGC